jgi:hypothetical protein
MRIESFGKSGISPHPTHILLTIKDTDGIKRVFFDQRICGYGSRRSRTYDGYTTAFRKHC